MAAIGILAMFGYMTIEFGGDRKKKVHHWKVFRLKFKNKDYNFEKISIYHLAKHISLCLSGY